MEEGYTTEGYYQACVNGTWIVFVSYEEYVEYIKDWNGGYDNGKDKYLRY